MGTRVWRMRRKGQASVLAAVVSILLIGTGAAVTSSVVAGGMRTPSSVARVQLVHAEDVAGNASYAYEPALSAAWPALSQTDPALPMISLAAVPAGLSSGPILTFTPQGASTVSNATELGAVWTEMALIEQTSDDVAHWTPPTRLIAPVSVSSDQPTVDGLRVLRDDRGILLAQSPSSGEATATPDEAAREADLAKQLANPIANLVSVPFQQNIEFGIGPANAGWHDLMNIQPVIPLGINEDWNLIVRPVIPVIYQNEIFPGAGSQFGLGDTTIELFFSPKAPTKDGLIWGIGPLAFVPSGGYLLSTSTWGAGVDAVVLKQDPKPYLGGGVLTYGALAFQLWPVSGAAPDQLRVPAAFHLVYAQEHCQLYLSDSVHIQLDPESVDGSCDRLGGQDL